MNSEVFRKWLVERGCRFDRHEQHERGQGHATVTIHREGKTAQLPLGGSHQDLDPRVARKVCEQLGLEWSDLPGPKSRA